MPNRLVYGSLGTRHNWMSLRRRRRKKVTALRIYLGDLYIWGTMLSEGPNFCRHQSQAGPFLGNTGLLWQPILAQGLWQPCRTFLRTLPPSFLPSLSPPQESDLHYSWTALQAFFFNQGNSPNNIFAWLIISQIHNLYHLYIDWG